MNGLRVFLVLSSAVVWAVFVLTYGTLAPWWRSTIGRNYLALAALIAGVLALVSLAVLGADPVWRETTGYVIYGGLLILGVRHLVDFIAGQLRGREQRLARVARQAREAHDQVEGRR